VPTYNRAALLPQAIISVLDQTYRHIEIIVVDDGSTDDTKSVNESFAGSVHYMITDHKGPAHARNEGMKVANGRYIAFLDSDDYYLPHKIELQVSFMEDHPEVGLVCSEFSGCFDGKIFAEFNLRNYHTLWKRKKWAYEDVFSVKGVLSPICNHEPITYYIGNPFTAMLQDTLICTTTILLRKEVIDSIGLQNEEFRFLEEYDFVLRIAKHFQIGFLNVPTYVLRYHANSMSGFLGSRIKTKEQLLLMIEMEYNRLNSLNQWACDDKVYHDKNRRAVEVRMADSYHIIGKLWLEYGNSEKARHYFRDSYKTNPAIEKYIRHMLFSALPSGLFRNSKRAFFALYSCIAMPWKRQWKKKLMRLLRRIVNCVCF
jgi:glycosyltransferase involved in cell wall biosynthesis